MTALFERVTQSRFLRFLVVGGSAFPIAEGVLWLAIHIAHANRSVAWLASFLCAATYTWWGNRNLTFADRKATTPTGILAEYGKFLAANGVGGAANFAVFTAVTRLAPAPVNDPAIALACGILAGLVFNFTISRWLVFRS